MLGIRRQNRVAVIPRPVTPEGPSCAIGPARVARRISRLSASPSLFFRLVSGSVKWNYRNSATPNGLTSVLAFGIRSRMIKRLVGNTPNRVRRGVRA